MESQLNLFEGRKLRDEGIERAEEHANKNYTWSDFAFSFLEGYICFHKRFMAEDVRVASSGIVPSPPSKRAWGAVFVKAVKLNLIRRVGYQSVKNPKAHCTPATIWEAT